MPCLLVGSLAFTLAPHARANLLVNGGFETGDFTGWTESGNLGNTGVTSGAPGSYYVNSGSYGAFLGAVSSFNYLSQSFGTVVGDSYTFSFWLDSNGTSPSGFFAYDGAYNGVTPTDGTIGASGLTEVLGLGGTPNSGVVPEAPWTEYSYNFTATTTESEIVLQSYNNPNYMGLDDVSVSGVGASSSVPEPAAYGWFGAIALAALVATRRFRRETATESA